MIGQPCSGRGQGRLLCESSAHSTAAIDGKNRGEIAFWDPKKNTAKPHRCAKTMQVTHRGLQGWKTQGAASPKCKEEAGAREGSGWQ